MARPLLLSSLLLLMISSSALAASPKPPRALLLPVTKDHSTLQYVTQIRQRTPPTLLNLVVDLGGRYSWIDCESGYASSTRRPVTCNATKCKAAFSFGCGEDTCSVLPGNPISGINTSGDLSEDVVSVQTTDGSNPKPPVSIPNVAFSCAPTSLLEGLVAGTKGMAGFGRSGVSLPTQLISYLKTTRKFALCLPSSGTGLIFLGDVGRSYHFLPAKQIETKSLIRTPLLKNPVSAAGSSIEGEPSFEYFIKVKGIKVKGNDVPLNTSLLSIAKNGAGGTKLSTVHPYTILETSIFKAVVGAFTRESGLKKVAPVAPFGACYDHNMGFQGVGPEGPAIELVLEGTEGASWVWWGDNSMVQVRDRVMCLGFVDGGRSPMTSIVVGAYQMENVLLEFDLANSRLGINWFLLDKDSNPCSNFNFTSVA